MTSVHSIQNCQTRSVLMCFNVLQIDSVFHGCAKTFIKVSAKGKASQMKKVKVCIGFTCNSLRT